MTTDSGSSTSEGGSDPRQSPIDECPLCGGTEFYDGFIDDQVQGKVRWIAGAMELGPFGGTRRTFKDSLYIRAVRCVRCGRLELFGVAG